MQDEGAPPTALERFQSQFGQRLQYYLDRSAPHTSGRWAAFVAALFIYMLRVFFKRLVHRYVRIRHLLAEFIQVF